MTEKPLKLGFIGGGINSAVGYTHKIASQIDNRWQLTAGCFSTNVEKNYASAKKYGVEKNRVYSNYHDFLKNERNLDAICVLTPSTRHTEIILEALSSGYAVICGTGRNSSQAQKICQRLKGITPVLQLHTITQDTRCL